MATPTAPFTPASTPPPGVIPNYENPENISRQVYEAGWASTIISFIFVAIRFYTRVWITKSMGSDDYAIFIAMAGSIVFMATTFRTCDFGVGMHMWEVPLEDFSPWFTIYNVISSSVYMVAICAAKLSIAFFFLRLSPQRSFKFIIYGFCTFIVLYGVINTAMFIFSCSPVHALWDMTVTDGKCIDRNLVLLVLSIFNIFTDFALLFLPIHIVVPLSLPKRQKVGLFLVFMSGTFVCAVAIVRTVLLKKFTGDPDATYTVTTQFVWAFCEINVGICCACFPQLKPFFRQYLPFIVSGGRSFNTSRKMRSQSHPLSSMHGEGTTNKTTSKNHTFLGSRRSEGDNTSTEEIYGQGESLKYKPGHPQNQSDGHIVRTTEVDVQYASNERERERV